MIGATVFDWLYHAARWTWHDPDGYNFISGPLADITLIGGGYAILRRHNCHVKGCLRIGRHEVAGTTYVVCRKHHPDASPTVEQVHAAAASAHARWHAVDEARATGVAAVRDVRHVAHEVASDVHEVAEEVHEVAEEVHEVAEDVHEGEPPGEEPRPPGDGGE